jgi:hypothetical protein
MDSNKFNITNRGHVIGQCIGEGQNITMSFGEESSINVVQAQRKVAHTMNDNTVQPKETFSRFKLVRSTDITGISGTGEIAVGVQWPDGTCHLFWLKTETNGYYKSIDQLRQIHCYPDASGQPNAHIEWMD